MKISKETIAILKNFASINSNLLIKKGSALSTINASKNVFADAKLAEDFPIDFGIYDVNEFLGVLSGFNEPSVDFSSQFAKISDSTSSVKYFAADPSVLTIPTKTLKFPSADINFELSSVQIGAIMKMTSVLRAPDVSFVGENGVLTVVVGDLKNPTANTFDLSLGETDQEFKAHVKTENLKLVQTDYNISISSKKISRFVTADESITVYVALESTSTFN